MTVNLATGRGSGGEAEGDRFFSVEAVQGSNFADRITGNSAANLIRGVGGADIVAGGGGADRFFSGDLGQSSPLAPDRILDFSRSQGDKIVIGDGKEDVPGFQKYQFIGKAEFTDVGQLRWYHENGDTIIEGNTAVKEGGDVVVVLDTLGEPAGLGLHLRQHRLRAADRFAEQADFGWGMARGGLSRSPLCMSRRRTASAIAGIETQRPFQRHTAETLTSDFPS